MLRGNSFPKGNEILELGYFLLVEEKDLEQVGKLKQAASGAEPGATAGSWDWRLLVLGVNGIEGELGVFLP